VSSHKMFNIEWPGDHLILTYKDGIVVRDVMDAYDAIVADPRSEKAKYFLFDFSACSDAQYTDRHYDINAAYSKSSWEILHRRKMRIGVIAQRPVIRSQILELFKRTEKFKHNWTRKLFETIEEARAWASEEVVD